MANASRRGSTSTSTRTHSQSHVSTPPMSDDGGSQQEEEDSEMEEGTDTEEEENEQENVNKAGASASPVKTTARKPFEALDFHIGEKVQQVTAHLAKVKASITEVDKDYRSRKDPVKSELYAGLKRYFRVYKNDWDRFRVFLKDMTDEEFEEFLKPRRGLEKLKSWDLKYKIQKLLRKLEYDCGESESRAVLYSTIAHIDVLYVAKSHNKAKWRTYSLKNPSFGTVTETTGEIALKKFKADFKKKFSDGLEVIEHEMFHESQPINDLFVYACKVENGLVFSGIRKQSAPTNFTKPEATRKRKKGKPKTIKETSETMFIVVKEGFPHFFVSGSLSNQEDVILKLVANSLGYKSLENQKLIGSEIPRLIEICRRTVNYPDLNEFSREFRAKEAKMKEKRSFYANSNLELERQFEMAAFKGADNSRDQNSGNKGTFLIKGDGMTTELKFKGTPAEVDEQILELSNQGYITDLKPFIKMKQMKCNTYESGKGDDGGVSE